MNKKSAINFAGSILDMLKVDWPNLHSEKLLREAQLTTGYKDFGSPGFKENLERLLWSVKNEAALTAIGKWSLYHETKDFFCSRLALYKEFNTNPETFQKPIESPFFITGLPRTGTTILQSLLAQDTQFRTPLAWEYHLAPHPPTLKGNENKKRIEQCQKGIDGFKLIVPHLDKIHPLEATLPQECLMGMAINFDSALFELKYYIPSYQKWYDNNCKIDTYQEHKMILQYLQKIIPTDRWLLKAPNHIANLKELFAIYPDARVVQTHRDLKKVLPSVASLHYQTRKAFGKKHKKKAIGKEMVEIWSKRLHKGITYRNNHPENKDRFFDLDFANLMHAPLKSMEKLYSHFNLELSQKTLQKMEHYLKMNPRGKHGKHTYSLEEFGIDETDLEMAFEAYTHQFITSGKNYD